MAALPGYSTTLRIPGTSTAITDEACTAVSSTVFQITDTAKRVLNPAVALTVKANTVTQAVGLYTVDPLFGKVTFAVAPTAPVTITGEYFPMLTVAEVFDASLSQSYTVLDSTVFGSDGVKTKTLGLGDFSGSFSTLKLLSYDNDTGGGTQVLGTIFSGRTQTLIEYRPGGSGDYFRGWVLLSTTDEAAPVDGRLEAAVNFTGVSRSITGEAGEMVSGGWGT